MKDHELIENPNSNESREDTKNPEFYLNQIANAMETLAYHSYRQRTSEGIDLDPVYEAINQLGNAIEALQKLGHTIPEIDLTGLPREFISCMDTHPATAKVAQWFNEMDRKKDLVEKWGTKEDRQKRLKSNIPPKRNLP